MKSIKTAITTPFIKLDSLLKLSGVCMTGGEAKMRIEEGEVFYNGAPCAMRGKKVYPGDTVTCGDVTITVVCK